MTSTHRKKLVNSEMCQACAACCKQFSILIEDRDDVLRFSMLDTDKIEVRELIEDKLWKIVFNYSCSKLSFRDGKYFCTVYGSGCTSYSKEYPNNFLTPDTPLEVLEDEKKSCPALRAL